MIFYMSIFPKVTVIMPVYNRKSYIGEAIDSVLKQSLNDFELIIIDDASTDNTEEIVASYGDRRIIYMKNETNKGVAYSRNVGYKIAKGKYIAIADSDDINHEERLRKMANFLDNNNECDVVVSDHRIIDEQGNYGNVNEFRRDNDELRSYWIFNSGLPSFMMFKKESFVKTNTLYHDESYEAAVDYQWYSSVNKSVKIGIIPEVLYYYRRHTNQISTAGYSIQQKYADKIRILKIKELGIIPTDFEGELHSSISQSHFTNFNQDIFNHCIKWLEKLSEANNISEIYIKDIFDRILARQLLSLVEWQGYFNGDLYKLFLESKFGSLTSDNVISNLLSNFKEQIKKIDQDIFIFGSKKAAYDIGRILLGMGKDFKGFIDNNNEVVGKSLLERKIYSLKEMTNCDEKFYFISILSKSKFDVSNSLIERYKVPKENIITFIDLEDVK